MFSQAIAVWIPFLVNLILVVGLIACLNSSRSSMANAMQTGSAIAIEKEHMKISTMLIAIVIWFLICNLPQ